MSPLSTWLLYVLSPDPGYEAFGYANTLLHHLQWDVDGSDLVVTRNIIFIGSQG